MTGKQLRTGKDLVQKTKDEVRVVDNVAFLPQARRTTLEETNAAWEAVRPPKVLVVDSNYEYFQTLLQNNFPARLVLDYSPDGFCALKLLKREKFDVLLCEMNLPFLSGLGLLQEFTKKHMQTPFIFMSSHIEEKSVRDALQAGAYNLIQKPVVMQDLVSKVKEAITLSRTQEVASLDDQDKAYIYNTLKMFYYDVDRIMLSIQHFQMPLASICEELDKKVRTGKCVFDDVQAIKYYKSAS